MKKIFLILILTFALVSCNKAIVYPEMDYNTFISMFLSSKEEQLNQEEDVYYIYFYQDYCTACGNIKNEALYTIELLKNDTVYFYKISSLSELDDDIYDAAIDYGERFGTPFMVKIENNQLTDLIVGTESVLNVLHGLS